MSKDKYLLEAIENSDYRVLSDKQNLEIDRIVSNEKENLILQLRVRNSSPHAVKIYSFVVSEFVLQNSIEKILENGWLQCSQVNHKKPQEKTVENKVFLLRDQNHYSFKKEYGYIENSIVSEWFTVIKMYGEDLFIGAVTTADQYSQIFIKEENGSVRVRVTCQYDGLILKPGQVVKSEKIFFGIGEENKIKNDFAKSLARHMEVKKVAEPIRAMCNSYYWNRNEIDEAIINKELDTLESFAEKLELDYFQLDAGYTKYFGDWLDYKDRFPNGFVKIIERIKKLGYIPGIWLSPFAISPGTKLHDQHKDWLIHNLDRSHFEGRASSPVDEYNNFLALEVLDPTNQEVKDYLRGVFTHFKNLGFALFKLDFLYPVCLTTNYSRKVTRARALREGLEFIREVIGNECKILSGIVQLSPIVGIADHVRTGLDVINPFVDGAIGVKSLVNNFMINKDLEESKDRAFLNGIVWRADPDCLIFRKDTGIDENIIRAHKRFANDNNTSLWIGDSIAGMNDHTKGEVLNFFNHKTI